MGTTSPLSTGKNPKKGKLLVFNRPYLSLCRNLRKGNSLSPQMGLTSRYEHLLGKSGALDNHSNRNDTKIGVSGLSVF